MKPSLLVLMGIALGCAAGAVGLTPSRGVSQVAARQVVQYCTDTGDYNSTEKLDALVKRAGENGWELIGVYRPTPMGATLVDYVCFRRP